MTRSIMDNMPCQHPQAEITAETNGDFERCKELKQWYKNHSGEPPRRKSDNNTEASLARWLDQARSRRARATQVTPCGRKLTASETAHLNNIIQSACMFGNHSRVEEYVPAEGFERFHELRQWCLNHSGELPHRASDDRTESSIAMWMFRAKSRRTRPLYNRSSGRQLTASETERLNSILTPTQVSPVAATSSTTSTEDDFERCEELRQWCLNHSGQHPRRTSDVQSEMSLAKWLDRALSRRRRACANWSCGRQLTAREMAHLNNILAQPQLVQVVATASETNDATATYFKDGIERCNESTEAQVIHAAAIVTTTEQCNAFGVQVGDFERCNQLRQWFTNHSGARPRRKSRDKTEVALARWLGIAMLRRSRGYDYRPSGRQLTAAETVHLNNILAQSEVVQVNKRPMLAMDSHTTPENTEHQEHWFSKRLRQHGVAARGGA